MPPKKTQKAKERKALFGYPESGTWADCLQRQAQHNGSLIDQPENKTIKWWTIF
jgi:hypothetical protein